MRYNNHLNDDESDDDDLEEFSCRICGCEDMSELLISPCQCTGTQKYVHTTCLQKWIMTR